MEADVIAWLKEQSFEGLEIQNFIEKKVNGEILSCLTKEGLEELGITSSLHQLQVCNAINKEHARLQCVASKESIEAWSEEDVQNWLSKLFSDLDVSLFKEEGIDGATLLILDHEVLQYLGIETSLQQIKLRTAIKREHGRSNGIAIEHAVEAWSEDDVFSWLSTQNFPSLDLERFKVEGIDGAMLVDLNDAALQELGIEAPLHRKMMRDVIDQLLLDPEGAAQKGKVKQIKFLEK